MVRDVRHTGPRRCDAGVLHLQPWQDLYGSGDYEARRDGALSLDDTLGVHLGEIDPFSEVTLRELLNHTSKIPEYVTFDHYLEDVYKSPEMPWTQDYVSARARDVGFLDLKEGDWSYSNTGYMYLRQVIEAITRVSFSKAVDVLVIRPLGLKSTYVACEVDRERTLIPAYDDGFRSANGDIRVQYHPGWCLTGVLVSNVREVCCLYRELAEGRLLAKESMREVLKGVPTPYWIGSKNAPYNGRLTYGLGLRLCESFPLGPFMGHGGDCPGYSIWAGYLALSDGRGISSCIVCNASDGVSPGEIWMKLIHCIGGQRTL